MLVDSSEVFLFSQIAKDFFQVTTFPEEKNLFITNEAGFDHYFSLKRSHFRQRMRSYDKKIHKQHSAQIINQKWAIEANELVKISNNIDLQSWKAEEGKESILWLSDEQLGLFYKLALPKLENDELHQYWRLFIDGEPVAFGLWLGDKDHIYYFKTSYDLRYRKLNLGSVLLFNMLKYYLDNGYKVIDFMCGEEKYKQRFATDFHECLHCTISNDTIMAKFVNQLLNLRKNRIVAQLEYKLRTRKILSKGKQNHL